MPASDPPPAGHFVVIRLSKPVRFDEEHSSSDFGSLLRGGVEFLVAELLLILVRAQRLQIEIIDVASDAEREINAEFLVILWQRVFNRD
ncbi:MAG TPA: hypothetical protein VLC10_00575, partial [Patescibacteria group bacterium]|nr:hypothetical protein [Patescibacteria group bacterium]